MSRIWIGVDLGTQGVRAVAVDDDGAVRASASRPLESRRWTAEDGSARHEQDPEAWCAGVDDVLAEVVAGLDRDGSGPVAGLAVDGTSGTVVLTKPDGTPLTPGVMYDDARGRACVDPVRAAGAQLWAELGYRVGETWALPTALALAVEHPGAEIRHQTDVVTTHLVGGPTATDSSTALKTGYDQRRGRWPTDVLDALDLDRTRLPDVVAPGAPLGRVGPVAAARTGLPTGTPVRAGMTDGCAAQLGAGAVAPGEWNAVLGTTLVVKGVTAELLRDPGGTVYCHRSPQAGWWLPGGASNVGAAVLSDVVDPARFDAVTARLEADPPDDVPVVLPLRGRGERFPFDAPDATGFWLDGDRPRGLDTLVASVGETAAFAGLAEGVAFVERLAFSHLAELGADVSGTRVISGGATMNRWWNRRRAAVLGVTLARPRAAEPAVGMALLARAAVDGAGGEPDLVAARDAMVHRAETYEPAPDEGLEQRYLRFRSVLAERGWT
ncbi:carbohydrate kinase [Actinomycetospora endophytica]|uniref:Carbohydrate kinase n=1 Tax=Actinomycetospora endophytica TaxID=2291215 RepID=A0ABS8PIW4_9PSEU|nr:FGGY family carbohydrate kinase [Actinomycetospora endophytica]MCD2198162.1 carbohydrate kinase [Actinomycetospora endophytica]